MTLGDLLGSAVSGVDQEWFAKVKHIGKLIREIENKGQYARYSWNNRDMTVLVFFKKFEDADKVNSFSFDYLDIDDAVRMVTKLYHGANHLEIVQEFIRYDWGIFYQKDVDEFLNK